MVLGTNIDTKAKHKNMLIKKNTIFINGQTKINVQKYLSLCVFNIVF